MKLLWILFLLPMSAYAEIQGDYITGEYIVKMKDNFGSLAASQVQPMMARHYGQLKNVISEKGRTVVVKKSILEEPEAVIAELAADPMVEFVEPNYIYQASSLPNDSRLGDLWGLKNNSKSVTAVDIDAEAAWNITKGDRNIVVAVIDTGVNYVHPDLLNNMWVNEIEANGQPGVDDDGNGFVDDIHGYDFVNNDGDPMDDNNHGTHCAGTIGAEGDNGIGVVGVNWQVSLMGLKFLDAEGRGSLEGALKSIDYAIQMNVNVMSNSWGGRGSSQNLQEAIERAEKAGILFVAAAGNNSTNNDSVGLFPASYEVDNVLSVAAVDSRGRLARFSNYGVKTVDVAAPGVDILSTSFRGGYVELSGTSMATPHVAGIAALMLAESPGLSYQQLKERLQQTSVPLSSLRNRVAYGLVNAYNAVTNNSPGSWRSIADPVSTPHPYRNYMDEEVSFRQEGASEIKVKFGQFETERNYDFVYFYDGQGNFIERWDGNHDGEFSPTVQGDEIIVRLKTDYSVTRYGFDVESVHFKE